jgi:hypothetical protein
MKRCHECGRRFGLIRHRWGLHQFCTKVCLERYKTRLLEKGREWCIAFVYPHTSLLPQRIARPEFAARFAFRKRRLGRN